MSCEHVTCCCLLLSISAQCDGIVDCQNERHYLLKRIMYRELVGAVYLLGNIYVIAKGSFHVLVLTGHSPYELIYKILLDGMDAVDIATSYADICVYVLDDGNGRVSRIGQDHSLSIAVDGLERGNLRSMSVTMDGRLVIVKKNSVISTYGKDGSLVSFISVPPFKPVIHAVEVSSNVVVCSESSVAKMTKEGILLQTEHVQVGRTDYVTVDRKGNLIACHCYRHQIIELDLESLQVTNTLLTLDQDGIEYPHHVQCVLENGMLLVCSRNCLDVYSSGQKSIQEHLVPSEDDTRKQQILEAELLESEVAHTNDAFKTLVNLYRTSGMDCVFSDLPPDPQQLPSASTLADAHLPENEVQRRVKQEDLNRIFPLLSRQSWATQYYHDVDDAVVRIGVDTPHKEEAERCLRDAFPHAHDLYEICDPWESSVIPISDSPDEKHRKPRSRQFQESQPELGPSTIISCRGKSFLFGGAIANCKLGLTVAHATKPGEEIMLDSSKAFSAADRIIGKCLETYYNLQRRNGEKLTADMALLEINSQKCSVDNTVRWPIPCGRTLHIKLYKGQKVPDDTRVMILDQNFQFQYGSIRRDHLTDMRLRSRDLHDVLAIGAKRGGQDITITQHGDSGAIVMSHPRPENDIVYVYGIVNSLYVEPTNSRSLTVANSLWDVVDELCTNRSYLSALCNNYNAAVNIDFM